MPVFVWTSERLRAAELLAEASKTRTEIAAECDCDRRTLFNWLADPEFKARVDEAKARLADEARELGICNVRNRLDALNDRWQRLQQVIRDRAAAPEMQAAPGGKTGVMVRTIRSIRKGDDFEVVELYAVDAALLRELREIEKQIAIEMGQWQEPDATTKPKPLVDVEGLKRTMADPVLMELMLRREEREAELADIERQKGVDPSWNRL